MSYYYYRNDDVAALLEKAFGNLPIEIFADSGAYSAATQNDPIDPVKYVAWVDKWQEKFAVAAGPDVIGDPVATLQETKKMLATIKGIPVLPVFHVGEDWKYLKFWVDESPYIALGGMVPYARQAKLLTGWVQRAFASIPKEVKVHGFGLTTWNLLRMFPWYSVDSTSWMSGFRYAQLMLFDRRSGSFAVIPTRQAKDILKHSRLMHEYGLSAADVRADAYNRDKMVAACVESWQRAEEYLSRTKVYLGMQTNPGASQADNVRIGNAVKGVPLEGPPPHVFMSTGGNPGTGTVADVGRGLKAGPPPHVYLGIAKGDGEKDTQRIADGYKARAQEAPPHVFLGTWPDEKNAASSPAVISKAVKIYLGTVGGTGAPNSPGVIGDCLKGKK
jgi:hypothetical protein